MNPFNTEAVGEKDPHGLNPHAPGAKLDSGKVRPGLVLGAFSSALHKVCEVGTYGAKKYSDNGWLSVPDAEPRYEDALLRHWLMYKTGQVLDPETGLPHIAHLAWNALAILELTERGKRDANDMV